ncbi:MAG: hypothetical protein A2X64_04455 [Ignavibacteria bacterium GWF2_33_9]|nr:MAG: hypothetical protein A2X64_04455 [Ignavibacteria bacterium GWF2_33_9]
MKKSKLFRMVYGLGIALIVFLIAALGGQNAMAQEIPNGDGDLLWKVPVTKSLGTSVSIHPINSNILIAGRNNEIYEFDVNNGMLIRTITCDTLVEIKGICITPDGKTIIVGLSYITQFIDYQTGNKTKQLNAEKDGIINGILTTRYNIYPFSNNKDFLCDRYVSQDEQYIERYDYINDIVIKRLNLYDLENGIKNVGISAITLTPDGTQFAVAYKFFNLYYIKIFDANTFELIQSVPYSWIEIIENLEFSSTNNYLSISSNIDLLADVVNLETNQKFSFAPKHMVKFSDDEKYWIIEAWYTSPIIDIYLANTYDKVFIINSDGYLRVFKDNKLFVRNGYNLSLYSSNWHFVDIKEKYSDSSFQINYSENRITLIFQNIAFIDQIFLADTTGREVARLEKIPVINNTVQIPIELLSGNYLLKFSANGKNYTAKFSVLR